MIKKIKAEIDAYLTKEIDLSEGVKFSQYKLIKLIGLFQSQTYPKGKLDSQGNYKYWYDIITPRVNSEIKNIDFDTKEVSISSEPIKDRLAVFLSNLSLKKWLRDNKIGEEINDTIESYSSLGNVIWKKTKEGYEELDLKNVYILNQTAKTLDDTDVIERHLLTQADLRAKASAWKNVDKVIKDCGDKFFKSTEKSTETDSSTPLYEIYERNGEVSEKDLFELQEKKGGDDDKYVLAKIIMAGLRKNKNDGYILFAEEIDKKPYKEAHRGKYEGRWFRKGLYEILFDTQTRANEIGNQIARGLEWAAKTLFRSSDTLVIQNTLTDIRNGDIIKAKELAQVEVRMQGLDQLVADWNRNLEVADSLANSYEVVTGESSPSGTPFRLAAQQNMNANKLFVFLRQKLALALENVFNDWIIPDMMKKLRLKEIIEITGDSKYLEEYYEMLANAWYINNLLSFPPHSVEQADMLKNLKIEELKKNKNAMIKVEEGFWDGFKPRAKVDITGEGVNLAADLETLYSFIQIEMDSIRRTALIEMAMAKKNVDISNLPKTPPQPIQQNQEIMPKNKPNISNEQPQGIA